LSPPCSNWACIGCCSINRRRPVSDAMPQPLELLIAEDNPADAELLLRALRKAGFEPRWRRVETEVDFAAALQPGLELVLSDYVMPRFSGLRALELLQASGLPVPLIIVSGTIGEETAVEAMKQGAADYLLKDRLARLGAAVSHALMETRLRDERRQANEDLRRANERYRALAAGVEKIRETERTTIAREIHDVLAQELTRLKIDLVWVGRRLGRPVTEAGRPELSARIAGATVQTDTAISTVQRIATELRPVILDSLGLRAAVEWQTEDFAQRTGLACAASAPAGAATLDRQRSTAVFRILQESLTNIARHAQATVVKVSLAEEAGQVVLTVQDNGRGVTAAEIAEPRAIGLLGMRERAEAFGGSLEIRGVAGAGTTVTARLPLADPSADQP
jgi:signal transduction histidine kinase